MIIKKINKASDINLDGIKVTEILKKDSSLESFTMQDKNGKVFKFCQENYAGIKVYVDEEPEFEEVYEMSGNFGDMKILQKFKSEDEANSRKIELEGILSGVVISIEKKKKIIE